MQPCLLCVTCHAMSDGQAVVGLPLLCVYLTRSNRPTAEALNAEQVMAVCCELTGGFALFQSMGRIHWI